MKVQADSEGRSAISQLADAALKAAGLHILPIVNAVNANFTLLEEPKEDPEPDGE